MEVPGLPAGAESTCAEIFLRDLRIDSQMMERKRMKEIKKRERKKSKKREREKEKNKDIHSVVSSENMKVFFFVKRLLHTFLK